MRVLNQPRCSVAHIIIKIILISAGGYGTELGGCAAGNARPHTTCTRNMTNANVGSGTAWDALWELWSWCVDKSAEPMHIVRVGRSRFDCRGVAAQR